MLGGKLLVRGYLLSFVVVELGEVSVGLLLGVLPAHPLFEPALLGPCLGRREQRGFRHRWGAYTATGACCRSVVALARSLGLAALTATHFEALPTAPVANSAALGCTI